MVSYKRTKNIIIAINKITLKKSFMYNTDEMYLINGTFPSTSIRTTSIMYNATCNNTIANIQKVNIM